MRIFSVQNIVLLGLIMCANGNVMDRLPQPVRQLLGKGTAVAMADKFDMNMLLKQLQAEQQKAMAEARTNPQFMSAAAQPFNFAEGSAQNELSIQQMPVPWEAASAASPEMKAEVNALIAQALASSI